MTELISSPWWGVVFLATTAWFARKVQGSWFTPSSFAAAVWVVYMAVPLMLLDDRISPRTVWTIVALISAVQVGALVMEDPHSWHARYPVADGFPTAFISRAVPIVLVCSMVAFIGAAAYAVGAIRRFAPSFSLEGFLSVGPLLYGFIVAGEADPWWFRLTRTWIFPAFFLGGMSAVLGASRLARLAGFLAFVPALIIGTTLASRYGVTLGIGCWAGGYLAAKVALGRGHFHLSRKLAVSAVCVFTLCVGLYVGIGIVRGHHYGDTSNYSRQLRGNLFGYLAVFDDFVKNEPQYARTWGQYSAAGLVDLVGPKKRVAALGYEPVVIANGVDTNIYTAFRGLIQDFSLPGALLFSLLGGAAAGRAYTRACAGRMRATVVLAAFYSFILWSPIVSVFNYNSVLLGLIVSWIVIVSCEARLKEQPGMRGRLRIATS